MSFEDWSNERHKKKKNTYDSFEEWSNAHHGISEEQKAEDERKRAAYYKRINSKNDDGDIAPVHVSSSGNVHGGGGGKFGVPTDEEEERTWFKKSKGNWWETVLGSATDIVEHGAAGVLGIGEKLVDAGATLGARSALRQNAILEAERTWMFNKLSGELPDNVDEVLGRYRDYADKVEKETAEFVAKDLYDEEEIAKTIISDPLRRQYGVNAEAHSVFGEKSDALAMSAGQLGAQIGVNAIAPGSGMALMGTTAFGSEAESAFQNGADIDEAMLSSVIAAGAEMLTEKIGGVKFGGKTLTDAAFGKMSRMVTGKLARSLVSAGKIGADALAEGGEELLSGYLGAVGQKLTYMEDKEIEELFSSEDALESFIGGVVLGGGFGVGEAAISGKDAASGLNKNEQAVVDRVSEDAIAEKEANGKKLTNGEKAKIRESVIEQMKHGQLDIDTIESVLGGKTYEEYKSLTEREKALTDEISTLENTPKEQITVKQDERLKAAREELSSLPSRDELKTRLSDEVFSIAKNTRLGETYAERARRGQSFEADLTQYKDEKQRAAVERAIKSGVLNNTYRAHQLVDTLSRIEADKGITFDYANNAKLKESGMAIDGKVVNGYVKDGGVTLNVQSSKAWQTTVGHEITHVLEGTEAYTELQKVLYAYAESKGELASRKAALTELYKSIEGTDIDSELTADLVGDYLFGSKDFIDKLTGNRTLFQKLWDEVKYLCKVATGKELTEIEKVEREFARAWKEYGQTEQSDNKTDKTGKADNVAPTTAVQYSLDMVDAVQPKSDKWSRTHTTEEAMSIFPNMWNVSAEESEVRNPTQITSTVNTYRKIYNFLQDEGFDGKILDASSGLGYGTRAGVEEYGFNVEDIEPYPDASYKPKYQDYSALDEKYDAIISNAVLNVLPQDQRDALTVKMGELLNDGGRLFVNVRGKDVETLAKTGKNIHLGNMEWIETVKGSYQKGFTKPELVAYLQDALGDGFTVEPTNMFGGVAAVVTKNGGKVQYSLSSIANTFHGDPDMSSVAFEESDYKQTDGYKNYVDKCLNNMRQTRADFDEASARQEVETQIDGIVRVALAAKKAGYDIYDDPGRRDKTDSKKRLLFSSLEPNSEYTTSHDISTICDKRQNFAQIYDDIVRAEEAKGVPKGKRFFDNVDNYFYLHKVLAEKGLTQPCRECYVESMRKNLAPMANAFLKLVNEMDVNNKANDQLYHPSGKNKGQLKTSNAELRERVLETLEEHPEYGLSVGDLTVEMLTTANGLAQLKIQAPLIYEAFNSFYGQSKPKMPKSATPFRFGELTALLTDHNGKIKQSLVDKINSTGGFRLQSYSDFQIQNYTDVLQVIFEAGTLGLNGHAYTKVPAFLEATEGTNLKRNISIFMYKDGDEWKIDRNDSFPYTLEEIYDIVNSDASGNTSIIAVSQNKEMSAWIMANDYIGQGIPFHKSGLKMETVRDTDVKTDDGRIVKGYSGTIDHTKQQTEVWAQANADHKALTKVKKGINIYSFWDFDNAGNLSKNELIEKNVKEYIRQCEIAGYLPKFRDYVINNESVLKDVLRFSKELGFVEQNATIEDISFKYEGKYHSYTIPYGYYKFLGDFGMFKPDGTASPHDTLSLNNYDFDKAESFFADAQTVRRNEILQQFANGEERQKYRDSDLSAEELEAIVKQKRQEVVDEIVAPVQYSISDSEGNQLSEGQQEYFKDSKARNEDGNLLVLYHGTPNKNVNEFSYDYAGSVGGSNHGYGFYFTDNEREASLYAQGVGEVKKAYLNITNPIYSEDSDFVGKVDELFERLPMYAKNALKDEYGDLDSARSYFKEYINKNGNGTFLSVFVDEVGMYPEVFNRILKNMGFDGIIYKEDGYSNEYVVFDSNQIKSVTNKNPTPNPDIRRSLSPEGEEFAPVGDYSTPLNETALEEDIAPVAATTEKSSIAETATPNAPFGTPTNGAQLDIDGKEVSENDGKEIPEKFTRKKLHSNIINTIKSVFSGKGLDFDDVLKKAKDLSTFSTVDNTPQRVMEKALGYKAGQALADLTVNKVAQNETEGIKWLNSVTNRKNGLLSNLSKQYNIKPGSKESAAAQMYAEGFYVNKEGEYITYGDAELARDFPNVNVQRNIKGLASDPRIRQFYDETLSAINESRTRNAYPAIPRLDNYFLHFRAMDDTFSKLGLPFNPNDIRAKDLPTDLNGVTADLKPGQPYFASANHRRGDKTSHDLLGGLERYATAAKNQIYHIDDIQTLRALRNYIADTYGQANGLEGLDALTEEEAQVRIEQVFGAHLSTFAKFLNEEANVLAGKTDMLDRAVESKLGRRWIQFFDTINKQTGSNMVGFNASSSLTNFLPVAQTFAKTNKFDFIKAFAQTVSNKLGSIVGKGDSFAEKSPVIIRRKGADRFYRTPFQKAGDVGYLLMSAVDDISTELIARTKFNELTRKGMDEQTAHFETDKWVSRLMGDRSLGQQPQLYNSKTLGVLTKFQLEVRNQLDSQFYDTIQEAKASNEEIENALARNAKTAAKVTATFVELAVVQHLFGKAFESVAGYNPAFDIISVLATMFGFDDEEESEDTVLDNIEQGFFELLEDLPYTSTFTGGRIPISSALPIAELIKGEDSYGNEKSRLETLREVAPYYVLPGGYGQIKKTIQGLGMFSNDHPVAGSYTDSGSLRFPVEETPLNIAQAAVFGQYASENAREYFDNDYAPLKEKQIEEYIDVELPIADYWKYREGLSGLKTNAEKADYINSLDIEDWQKNLLMNNILDRKEDVDMSNYDDYSSFEEFDYATKNPEKYEFLNENGIAYSDFANADEDTKNFYSDAYTSVKKNPAKRIVSKVVSDNYLDFYSLTRDINKIESDKDRNGKTITGSRKEKVIDYINNLDADYYAKIILYKSEYPSDDTYDVEIIEHLNSRQDLTYEERVTILTELGFRVENGYIYAN